MVVGRELSGEGVCRMLFKILNFQSLGAGPEFFNNMEHSMNVAGNEDPKDSFFNNQDPCSRVATKKGRWNPSDLREGYVLGAGPGNIIGVQGGYACPEHGPCQDTLTWDK